jgi:sec-independent protein translocase protein TatA
MGPIGLPELGVVLLIVLIVFGPKRLPQMGRSLGSGMREFKDGITGKAGDDDGDEAQNRPEITAAQAGEETPPVSPPAKDAQGSS